MQEPPLSRSARASAGDSARTRRFYDPLFNLLGLRMIKATESGVHYGTGDILFSAIIPSNGQSASAGNGAHIAFHARDRAMVEAFYGLALRNGGRSDGNPATRPDYDPNYFAAFVLDPDGNKIEAVTFAAEVSACAPRGALP